MKNKTATNRIHTRRKISMCLDGMVANDQLVEIPRLTFSKIAPLLPQCVEELKKFSNMLRKAVSGIPAETLYVSPHQGSFQYYKRSRNSKKNKGEYIPKANIDVACDLARKKYYSVLADFFDCCHSLLSRVDSDCNIANVEKCFEKQGNGRQRLLKAVYLSDDEYAKKWSALPYHGLEFFDDSPSLFTAKGERVRSKTEVIIADMLNRLNVPYRYEFPLRLSNGKVVYPDFTCLNLRTREEFLWEHFGMMGDEEYLEKMLKKLDDYSAEGFVIGKNLICSMESASHSVNQKQIEQMIRLFLK